MIRAERAGLAGAVVGHVVLFALLSLVWGAKPTPLPLPKPIEVSLVDDVALDQVAPPAPEPPAQSAAPEQGAPEDAPPPAMAPAPAPDPTPPKPQPEAMPPPKAVPQPKPLPPVKKAVAEKVLKPDRAKTPPSKAAAPPAKAVAATQTAGKTGGKTAGTNPQASKAKATGSLLDDDFRKGLTQTQSKSKSRDAAPGVTMDAKAAADIGSAIRRQVQPCADRQVNPGPGASRIVVTIALQLNRDGTLAGRPTVSDEHGGVDDENRRYVDAVDRNAIATFSGCAPLRGLPSELYDVPRGWKTFKLRYKLPG